MTNCTIHMVAGDSLTCTLCCVTTAAEMVKKNNKKGIYELGKRKDRNRNSKRLGNEGEDEGEIQGVAAMVTSIASNRTTLGKDP